MKKVFFLLIIIAYQALFFATNQLHASSNQNNVFRIHGTEEKKEVIKGDRLNELLKAMGEGKDIDIEYAEIKGDIDFTNPEFFPVYFFDELKEDLSLEEIAHIKGKYLLDKKIVLVKGGIKITNSIINGNITTYHEENIYISIFFKKEVNFFNTRFAESASFYGDQFVEKTKFESAQFAGVAIFEHAQFAGGANFRSAHFAKGTKFWFAKFVGEANFEYAKFAGWAGFLDAEFAGWANFRFAHFAGKANFRYAKFAGGASFGVAQFAGEANFWDAQFAGKAYFGSAQFADCSFNSAMFGLKSAYTAKYLKREDILKIITKDTNTDIKNIESLEIGKSDDKYFIGSQQLSPRTISLIYAYRAAINEENVTSITGGKSVKETLPEKEIKAYDDTTSHFSNAIFTKFADFRNAIFLCDIDFGEARFKEAGLFDGCVFFNAEELGLVEENNAELLVNLNLDNAYFNLLKGVSFKQLFPHLHKRLKFDKVKDDKERQSIIDNYIYLQENFRKIGRFEDADKIYYERRVLEAEQETSLWNQTWNCVLDITCKYGTDFKRIVIVCLSLIGIFTVLYFLTIISWVHNRLGTIEIPGEAVGTKRNGRIPWPRHLWHAFYLSVNSFTTLGTGDIIVTGLFRVLVILEGGLGWFMLGLFIVVLAAQYIR